MLLFMLWAMLVLAALTGAGYSHFRYRAVNDQYYERLFAKNREQAAAAEIERHTDSRLVPLVTIVIVSLLVPMSFVI